MKKLLFLFVAVTLFSCSEEDAPQTLSSNDVTMEFESRFCLDFCTVIYKINNNTDHRKLVTTKITFNRVDSHYESAEYVATWNVNENSSSGIVISADVESEIISAEILSYEDFGIE